MAPGKHRYDRGRAGFTLVEAIVATSIMTVAGSALLLGVSSAMQTTTDALDETIAKGLAQQLMDEIAGCRYAASGAQYAIALGPSAFKLAGAGRERFDEIGDYNGYESKPPKGLWGVAVELDDGQAGERHARLRGPSSFFANWRQSVSVYYVRDDDQSVRLAAGQTSNCRAVEVAVFYDDAVRGPRELSRLRRVFSYVPSS